MPRSTRARSLGSGIVNAPATPPDRELTLADYGRAIWRGRTILFTAIAVAAIAGLALTFIRSTVYTGTAQVFLGQATTLGGAVVTLPFTNPTIAPTVLEGDELVDPVAEETGVRPGRIRSGLTISIPRAPGSAGNLPTLAAISFEHPDAETARAVTNAYAERIVAYNDERFAQSNEALRRLVAQETANVERLEGVVADLRSGGGDEGTRGALIFAAMQELASAQTRRTEAELELATNAELRMPGIITRAGAPDSSTSGPRRVRTVLLAALIGAVVGMILALAWSGRDRRVGES